MSDKFKFSEEEREELSFILQTFYAGKQDYDIAINAFEQLIQDRGNSIQDGWIDVNVSTPEFDGEYLCVCHEVEECGEKYDRIKIAELYMNKWQNRYNSLTSVVTHWQPLPQKPNK